MSMVIQVYFSNFPWLQGKCPSGFHLSVVSSCLAKTNLGEVVVMGNECLTSIGPALSLLHSFVHFATL